MSAELPEGSVTRCIVQFRSGDRNAFDKIWDHYFPALVKVARKMLATRPTGGVADEDDIVQNALWSVCQGLPRNKTFEAVDSRQSLWPILVAITKFKVTDHLRREGAQKRGAGRVFQELPADGSSSEEGRSPQLADILADETPTADDLVAMTEQFTLLMEQLPKDDLRQIARLHIEGWKNAEIADQLGISIRGVERKLALIRDTWYEWWRKQEE